MSTHTHSAALKKIYSGNVATTNAFAIDFEQTLNSVVTNYGTTINYRMYTYDVKLHLYSEAATLHGWAHWQADFLDHFGFGNEFIAIRDETKAGVLAGSTIAGYTTLDQPRFIITLPVSQAWVYCCYVDGFITQITN